MNIIFIKFKHLILPWNRYDHVTGKIKVFDFFGTGEQLVLHIELFCFDCGLFFYIHDQYIIKALLFWKQVCISWHMVIT